MIGPTRQITGWTRCGGLIRVLVLSGGVLLAPAAAWSAEDGEAAPAQRLHYGFYADLGYTIDFNHPGNDLWRSKQTTIKVNEPRLNMALAFLSLEPTEDARWGMKFGLQTGVDTDLLVPQPPPDANDPISHANTYAHIYRANISYLFPAGKGLRLTAGLINGYIGYESYHAMKNPNYTRGYQADYVPYFMVGVKGDYPVSDTLDLAVLVVTGWEYLAHANGAPSLGGRVRWRLSPRTTFIQNIYYGPDQDDTALEFWRIYGESIVEWKIERWLLAGNMAYGNEKQAAVAGQPHADWLSGALWAAFSPGRGLTFTVRAELFRDPDGLLTRRQQTLEAYTATCKYLHGPVGDHRVATVLEYRFDRSSGPDGGFYSGDDNTLVPDQNKILLGVMWAFGDRPASRFD